jgi:hypothetical protein
VLRAQYDLHKMSCTFLGELMPQETDCEHAFYSFATRAIQRICRSTEDRKLEVSGNHGTDMFS